MVQGSRDATALVGLPGLVVGAHQLVDGELCGRPPLLRTSSVWGLWALGKEKCACALSA